MNKKNGKKALYHTLAVHHDHRNQGIPSALMYHAEKSCIDPSTKRIRIDVDTDNEPAIACYKKFGFNLSTKKNKKQKSVFG